MSALRFVCPVQRREIDSGIEIDARTFQKIREQRVEVHCPLCETAHEFRVVHGRLDELHVA
jgi:hypothetical protein